MVSRQPDDRSVGDAASRGWQPDGRLCGRRGRKQHPHGFAARSRRTGFLLGLGRRRRACLLPVRIGRGRLDGQRCACLSPEHPVAGRPDDPVVPYQQRYPRPSRARKAGLRRRLASRESPADPAAARWCGPRGASLADPRKQHRSSARVFARRRVGGVLLGPQHQSGSLGGFDQVRGDPSSDPRRGERLGSWIHAGRKDPVELEPQRTLRDLDRRGRRQRRETADERWIERAEPDRDAGWQMDHLRLRQSGAPGHLEDSPGRLGRGSDWSPQRSSSPRSPRTASMSPT